MHALLFLNAVPISAPTNRLIVSLHPLKHDAKYSVAQTRHQNQLPAIIQSKLKGEDESSTNESSKPSFFAPSSQQPASTSPIPSDETDRQNDEAELLTEQMAAYFQATDSTFQPSLASFSQLSLRNFATELGELLLSFRRLVGLEPPKRFVPPDVMGLRLSNEAVANREREREFRDGRTDANPFVRFVYDVTCQILDVLFDGRPIQRFWYLETVARMPYFAFSSCLHLYATLGWYRSPTMMNMHHAEELNEAYHLAVMESLGGDKSWPDRFLAFHTSLFYYWFLVIIFFVSPAQSYCFGELLEQHAVDTYAEFLESNEKTLKQLPAPAISQEYYANFLYYFYEFQMTRDETEETRPRPNIESLYDVFDNILRDEIEHSRTMTACTVFVDRGETMYYNGKQVSASSRGASGAPQIPPSTRQMFWKKWSKLKDRGQTVNKKNNKTS